MKYRDCVTIILACHGTLMLILVHKMLHGINGKLKLCHFCYVKTFSHNNKAKYCVNDHNNHRHVNVSLSDVWRTKWWPHRQFTFVLGIAKVNIINMMARTLKLPADSQLQFWGTLKSVLFSLKQLVKAVG